MGFEIRKGGFELQDFGPRGVELQGFGREAPETLRPAPKAPV